MALPRLQLFEFNDAPWAPATLRAMLVESLSIALERGRLLDGLVAPLADFLVATRADGLLDLGSGSGAPARVLLGALAERGLRPRLTLSDLHPRVAAWEAIRERFPDQVDLVPTPLDATAIPAEVSAGRARIIVNVLHHFPAPLVRAVLADAVRSGQGIFIAESFGRRPLAAAGMIPTGLPALLASPLRGADRALRAGLVWGSPLALIAGAWDTLVSTMRIWEADDLHALAAELGGEFEWRSGRYPVTRFGDGLWFSGTPRA
ncbi:MAG: class I SAM-dependent methyltransferase [Deltaproteobacteria bacterium]|nr:class I SAM-dependent methyltransferase [Deltaproteobacteria bacterium]